MIHDVFFKGIQGRKPNNKPGGILGVVHSEWCISGFTKLINSNLEIETGAMYIYIHTHAYVYIYIHICNMYII